MPTEKFMPRTSQVLLTLVALFTIFGPYAADWNATHIYNPVWPPHAKFHNAQTMSMAVCLGLAGLFFVWRKGGDARSNIIAANLFLSFYWITQLTSFFFPGVAWTDPELLQPGQSMDQLAPQYYVMAIGLLPILVADILFLRSVKASASAA